MNGKLKVERVSQAIRILAGVMLLAALPASQAVLPPTDLADTPLANSTGTVIPPNIAIVIDDSGSMDDENMPESGNSNNGSYCYKWYMYNGLAYNPATNYLPPIQADGSSTPALFTAARSDGYFPVPGATYGNTSNTSNRLIDLRTLGTVTTITVTSGTFPNLSSKRHSASSLLITLLDGSTLELLTSPPVPDATGTSNRDTLGAAIAANINANNLGDFSAAYSSSNHRLTITAPASQAGLTTTPQLTLVKEQSGGSLQTVTFNNHFVTNTTGGIYYATNNTDPNSTSCDSDSVYDVVSISENIAAPGVTAGSAAALTNYANWYSYYRKRNFMMKAAAGRAFSNLPTDGSYRVGLFFIDSIESGTNSNGSAINHDLAISTFSGTARSNWFTRLYTAHKAGFTPLRGALSRMGRMFAGKISGWDPLMYSCQRNYTILSTDGYWNTDAEVTSGTNRYGPYKMDNSTLVGDQDGATGVTLPEYDHNRASNTLADVAYYYYHHDLRNASQTGADTTGTCTSPTTSADVCADNVPPVGINQKVDDVAVFQHMTTYTVGLGVSGTLNYSETYKTDTSGDYYNINQGTKYWPTPSSGGNTAIDDLWHAAVNGRGTYFSAKDPAALATALDNTLNAIKSTTGSGAAAATSNLQPTTGDNSIYIATYTTIKWDGELSAYTVDLGTGAISAAATWQATPLLTAKILATGDDDTRTIYTANGTPPTRTSFASGTGGLTGTQLAYFDNTKLTQHATWSAAQSSAATPDLLVRYLRGQNRYEDVTRDVTYGDYQRLYRARNHILGDIIHAQPIYVRAPQYNFADTGYSAFKTAQAGRLATIYAAANDGMLHAFDATNNAASYGQERWAYIPPMVLPNLWNLADSTYANNHRYFLDGPMTVSDGLIGTTWKTVLIGAMGKGGRGYFALDITDPTSPQPLWNFTADDNNNVGYSYGTPAITKLANGTWVAVVTSGYDNIPETSGGTTKYASADGGGYVFVLNLSDGSLLRTISTGVGSAGTPSGLAKLNLKTANFDLDNTALGAYGGDLLGNLWSFNLDAGTARKVVGFGASKPIMVAPEIADINGNHMVFFGTGKYLGLGDLSTSSTQTIYGIKDDGATTLTDNSLLQQQTISGSPRTVTNPQPVNLTTQFGWYINLPDSGERVAVDPQLYFGTLLVASTVPSAASVCQPGGYSFLYQLNYSTGSYVGSATDVGTKYLSPIVGLTVAKLPSGTPVVYPITADGSKPVPDDLKITTTGSTTGVSRILWRELTN
jgi:type IV pilus assembly protein PilY1